MNPRPKTMNYTQAKTLAIKGIQNYLENKTVTGDRDGMFHGILGKTRAQKALTYLSETQGEDEFMACMLAIFQELERNWVFKFKFHRSSRLAGLISDQWFNGERRVRANNIRNTLTSSIVNQRILHNSVSKFENTDVTPRFINYFNKTQGARDILNIALERDFEPGEQKHILNLTETLKKRFNTNVAAFIPDEGIRLWAKAATMGALLNRDYYKENENYDEKPPVATKAILKAVAPKVTVKDAKSSLMSYGTTKTNSVNLLSIDTIENISHYLSLTDSIFLTRTRKKARESVNTVKDIYPNAFKLKK